MSTYETLRSYIRSLLIEEKKKTLGEPDVTAEKLRDEPQPQYEDEENESKDTDEASSVGGMGSGLGPAMPLQYDSEKPVYNPYKKNKK
tara:strand:- start:354 stop:617 length:264 start_codon:yes stop_codon:yes gene_type:complete